MPSVVILLQNHLQSQIFQNWTNDSEVQVPENN